VSLEQLRRAARAYRQHQASVAQVATGRATAVWSMLDSADLSGSWASHVGPQLVRMLTAAQQVAASSATAYVGTALTAQDAQAADAAQVQGAAFSGTAADGRALAALMYLPVIDTKVAVAGGASVADALGIGLTSLTRLVETETADAGRDALWSSMAATPAVHGYVRMVSGSACSRCILLAGRHYRWNASFLRHPHCHCTGIPAVEDRAGHLSTDPHAFFGHLSPAEQDARFGKADAEAIRSGADIFQVVNARRGLYKTEVFGRDVQVTTEGTTRRGIAGQVMRTRLPNGGRGLRLSVAQIFADAGEDRALVTDLLRKYGYLF
jgi:hypothetical protein